ncbi:hypothetical protein, partial [Eubacterium aggregans]|uniref:hypothetical protein n=1 Tax=Eubacterium aggregans TaxID=81409 RepID=UPI003F2B0E93
MPIILKNLPAEEKISDRSIDVWGILLLSLTIFLVILSLDFNIPILLLGALVVGTGFVFVL